MAHRDFIESRYVYFDYNSWGFRTFRKRISATVVEMSTPCNYWNDAITSLSVEKVSEARFIEMVYVPSPKSFILCKLDEFGYRIIPLRRVVGQYILIASAMKKNFDED